MARARLAPRASIVAVVAVASFVALAQITRLAADPPAAAHLLAAVGFAVLMIVTEMHPIQVSHTTRLSVTAALDFAVALTLGPAIGGLVAALSSVVVGWQQVRHQCQCGLLSVAFNAANATLAVFVCGIIYQTASSLFSGPFASPAAGALAGAGYLLVNLGLLAGMVHVSNQQESISRTLTRWLHALPQYLGLLAIGGVGAAIYLVSPMATLLLVVPLAIMYYTIDAAMRVRRETKVAIEALAHQIDQRSRYTADHSTRVAGYAEKTAIALGLAPSQVDLIARTARIHDLGKIYLPTQILEKDGSLQDWEWAEMRKHPITGAELVKSFADYRDGADMIRYHHERLDGRGYPFGIDGHTIPLGARILAVADSFDAMTSDRPYRAGMTFERAVRELQQHAGTQFDPRVVEAFLRSIGPGDVSEGVCASRTTLPAPRSAVAMSLAGS
ncbi:MAG: HD-GYP domain-containing protein [Chloroflexi bacterium]|nr:HD-GYP domain-containing protein [Chloroflexota bacterium]